MKLILHIGIPKTGTTSIQKWLSSQPTPDLGGVFYPSDSMLPGSTAGNHRGLVLYSGAKDAWDEKLGYNIRQRLPSKLQNLGKGAFQRKYQDTLGSVIACATREQCESVLLSTEHMSERLDDCDLDWFSSAIQGVFNERVVVVYLREQCAGYESLYGEALKQGYSGSFSHFAQDDRRDRMFSYRMLIRRWESRGWKVIPRVFHERGLAPEGWSLKNDFAEALGLRGSVRDTIEESRTSNLNTSLSSGTFLPKRRFNQLGLFRNLSPAYEYQCLRLAGKVGFTSKLFRKIYAREFRLIREKYAADNMELASMHFGCENLFSGFGLKASIE